jgi:hypothetical protein
MIEPRNGFPRVCVPKLCYQATTFGTFGTFASCDLAARELLCFYYYRQSGRDGDDRCDLITGAAKAVAHVARKKCLVADIAP